MLRRPLPMLAGIAAALAGTAITVMPLNAQSSSHCGATRETACYLLAETLVRAPRHQSLVPGNEAAALISNAPVVENSDEAAGSGAARSQSNQLTIIGWMACVYLIAKGLEFALSARFREMGEAGTVRVKPAALFTAMGLWAAAIVFFLLLNSQSRQAPAAPKTYVSMSDCLRDAQTMNQIHDCESRNYAQPSATPR